MSNNKYDVYAIGNALVDYEIEVDDQFFINHAIEKSLMTLVDDERQQYLVDAVKGSVKAKQGGGSAANSVVAMSALGGRAYYSCKVANDEDGKLYLAELHNNGLATNLSPGHLEEGTTGKCLVMVTPDAERTMNTYLGITADFSVSELDEEALSEAEYLFMEGYLVTSDNGLGAMKKARELAKKHGVKVSMSFSDPSMVKYFGQQMREIVGDGVDLLFCNEEEALEYTDTTDVEAAAEALKSVAGSFAITLGKKGALIYDGKGFTRANAPEVAAIDTNGAGDMFCGAFLYGLTNGIGTEGTGKLACHAASAVVTKYGPRLSKEKLEELRGMV